MTKLPRLIAALVVAVAAPAGAQSPAGKEPVTSPATATPKAPEVSGFALIPAGEFVMGGVTAGVTLPPVHKVNVSAFHLQTTDIWSRSEYGSRTARSAAP